MSQSDYSSLISKSVDVQSTMSYEMSSAISASAGVKVGLAKAAGSAASALGGPKVCVHCGFCIIDNCIV